MDILEKLLVVARDAASFYQLSTCIRGLQEKRGKGKRRRTNLPSERADKGKW